MTIELEEIAGLIARQLGTGGVTADQRLVQDLGAESADLLNIVVALENRYRIHIPEELIPRLETVADVHRAVIETTAAKETG